VLVPDSYDRVEIAPALWRLASIVVGMALLEPVLLAWHAIAAREKAPAPSSPADSGSE